MDEEWLQDYPTIDDLEEWLQAARAQWAAFEKQTPEERAAARRELLDALIAYEEAMEWPMASPDAIRGYLEQPLLGLGPTDRPWPKHFLLAVAAHYWCRIDAGRFTLVSDMLKFLSGMVANARLPVDQCIKAREVLQYLDNRNIPDPLTYRLSSTTPEAEGWLIPVQTAYKRVHADIRYLWKKTPRTDHRAEALRRGYPDLNLSREDSEYFSQLLQNEAAKEIVGRMFGGVSADLIKRVLARASRRPQTTRRRPPQNTE